MPRTESPVRSVRIGLCLPSFVDDPDVPLSVARTAEAAGLDAVFVYDHLYRYAADGTRRPALEGVGLLGAVAATTERIAIGSLVFRAWLRPPAALAAAVNTAARIAPGRVIATIGAGDSQSREENESFGLGFGTAADRVARLDEAVVAVRDHGAPVWVGGRASAVRAAAAAHADGWNAWGAPAEQFAEQVAAVRAAAVHAPFECSWGGLVVLDTDDDSAAAKAKRLGAGPDVLVGGPERVAAGLRVYAEAGADWVIVAPVDSRDPANADVLGTEVRPRLRS